MLFGVSGLLLFYNTPHQLPVELDDVMAKVALLAKGLAGGFNMLLYIMLFMVYNTL